MKIIFDHNRKTMTMTMACVKLLIVGEIGKDVTIPCLDLMRHT